MTDPDDAYRPDLAPEEGCPGGHLARAAVVNSQPHRRYRGMDITEVRGRFEDDYYGVFRFGGWRATCPKCGRAIGGVYQSDLRRSITDHVRDLRRCTLLEAAK